jgi:hypothetical protein
MLQPMRNYPFAKGLSFMPRGTWRPIDKWLDKGVAPAASAGTRDYDTIIDPGLPDGVRTKLIAALMFGGEFARQVASEVAEMVDDGRLDPSAGAALLRALRATELQSGTAQSGDGAGGEDRRAADADGWAGMGDPDRRGWAGGKSRSGITMRKVPMDALGKPRNRRS